MFHLSKAPELFSIQLQQAPFPVLDGFDGHSHLLAELSLQPASCLSKFPDRHRQSSFRQYCRKLLTPHKDAARVQTEDR